MAPSTCRSHHLARPPSLPDLSLLLPVTSPGQTSLVARPLSLVAGLITWPDLPCCQTSLSLSLPVSSPGQISLVAGHFTWPDLPCCRSHPLARPPLLLPVTSPGQTSLVARPLSCCRSHHLARPPLLPDPSLSLSLLLPVTSPGQTSLVAGHITWPDPSLLLRSLHQARSLFCCRSHHLARPPLLPVTSPGQTPPSCCRSHHLARPLLLPVTSPGQTSPVASGCGGRCAAAWHLGLCS